MAWMTRLRLAALQGTLTRLDQLASRRGRAPQLPAHLITGHAGEDAAFFYLRRKGYTVVARRWTSGDVPGDVDLIAWQGSLLCFVEVKPAPRVTPPPPTPPWTRTSAEPSAVSPAATSGSSPSQSRPRSGSTSSAST